MKFILQFLIGILFIKWSYSQHNPLKDPNICGLPECKGGGKFKYAPGNRQTYKYSAEIKTFFNGTSKNESKIYVDGTVQLNFLSPCDGFLDLSDFKLSEDVEDPDHANSGDFAAAVNEYSLRFEFKDGVISELCPSEKEETWVLNFKRGILSLLHNTMKRFDLDHSVQEEDVRGKCPTNYRVLGANGTSLLIEKTKDLSSCERRSKFHSVLQTTTNQNFESRATNNGVLKSYSQCNLSIDHNIYNEITCQEIHNLNPFSNEGVGVSTTVLQKLSLVAEETTRAINEEFEILRRAALNFDHVLSPKRTQGELKTARDLIKKLCQRTKNDGYTDLSDIFSKLIQSLRLLAYPALSALYGHSRTTCTTGRKHLLDVLPFVNTAGSVAVMRDIMLKESVPQDTINEWLISIAFITNPDENIIAVAADLLQTNIYTPMNALTVASLTHSYCTQHSNCENNDAVSTIVQYLESRSLKMLKKKHVDNKSYDEVMVTLKALSNIGVLTEEFQEELYKVIENNELDAGLRIAAVETFRRFPCEQTRSYFEQIFRNQDENSEVRIASYLQIMRCPNYLLIRTIRHTLQYEEVNQVGSFVWTHLTNLLKTSVPSKVEIQSLLSQKDLVKKFSNDIRKFSRNFEGSLYFDDYNFGGNYESNVIFSTTSYVPKSAMFNFTVDLFGETVNLFEVYGRLEGFEHYLESLFGPKSTSDNMVNSIIKKVRHERSVRSDELLKNQVAELPNIMKNSIAKDPQVFLGLKVFGNEIKYMPLRGKDEISAAIETLNPIYHLKRIFSGKEINYNKAVMFLDCKYVVPTGTGFPLSLSALGTSSINVKIYGSLKTAGFSKDKELEVDLTADIQPTVSFDVTGEMSVDAFYSNTAAKLKTNTYTDTAVTASVKVRGARLVSIKFSLPRQKNEIFSARSKLLLKVNENEESQSGFTNTKALRSSCSWPSVDKTIGLKVCAEYNFANMSSMDSLPHFLLAGPSVFRWYINKSDPTANIYLFEYKWAHRKDQSAISLIFDTPGSEIKRVLNANFTIDRQSQNLTMLLQSSAGTVLARGRYKNTEVEKFIEIALDINNKKHFDASASLTRSNSRNGYSYRPKIYVGVNGERVVKLDGSIITMSKKGISQYTVDLKFETKRLNSKLFGYISKSESSLEVNLYGDYKFLYTKEQRIVLKFGIANRSRKNIIVIVGFCNLNSTAYPNMNFASNATFQRSGSHMDLTVKLEQNPFSSGPDAEKQILNFDLLFSYKIFTDNKRVLRLDTGVSRKSSNLALKGEFTYESFHYDVNMAGLVKYGNNKQVAATIFWSHPRSTSEQLKTRINITIPSFTPMIFKLDLQEKHPKDYMIDVTATWFSGDSISVMGFYQDKSSPLSSNHHLKLFLNSSSFKVANTDLQYYRDNDVIKLDFRMAHNNSNYQLFFLHRIVSSEETKTHAEIKYKDKMYRFLSSIYDGNHRRIVAELHIDQIRDIDFSLWIYNQDNNKAFGFVINWDANRDPNQKLLISGNYTKLADFNHIADFTLSYPSRTIIGEYRFLLHSRNISTLASVSWDDGNTFAVDLNLQYGNEERLFLEFVSKLRTPFENWKLVKLDGLFEHIQNKYVLNGIMAWDKGQRVALDISGNYVSQDSSFTCKYSCSIASSLNHIPNINITISHDQNKTNFNTVLHLMYNPDFVIGLESQWKVKSEKNVTNLTGTINTYTPFKGLRKGMLISKIFLKNQNFMKGVAHVDLDDQKLEVNLEGKFKRITNCMLIVNVSTSLEEYQLRFRISTEDRHLVALVLYPTGSLGTEVLLSVNGFTNFDAKFLLATPVEFLQKVIIVGKLKPTEADFRLGWNSLLIGFTGIWNYEDITNFEYVYKIYTPIEDFEENGIVARLQLKEGLNTEMSIKLSKYKLGVKLLGQSKPKEFKEVDIKLRDIYLKSKASQIFGNIYEDPLNWKGLIEIDIIIYPTMKGELEIDQKEHTYVIHSKLVTPNGIATLHDELEYIDILKIRNDLKITTPYISFNTVSSNLVLQIEKGRDYVFSLNVHYTNRSRLIQTGIYAQYLHEQHQPNQELYNITLKVYTPFAAFPKLNLLGTFESEPNLYHTIVNFNTNRSDISVDATAEIKNKILDIFCKSHITTPSINIPPFELKLLKLFSPKNNFVEITLNMPERLKTDVHFKTSWLIRSQKDFRTMVQLETPFTGLENTTASVDLYISDKTTTMSVTVQMHPIDMEMQSSLQNNVFTSTSSLNLNGKRFPLYVNCTILKPSQGFRQFDGNLKFKDKLFKISGDADVNGHLPSRVDVTFTPTDNTPPLIFEYNLRPTALNKYKIVGRVQHSTKLINFNAYLSTTDKFNWEFYLELDANATKFNVHTKAHSDANTKNLLIEAHTPITKLEKPKLGITYTMVDPRHTIHGFFEVTDAKGTIDINLIWKFLENMHAKVVGKYENKKYISSSTLEGFYENPQQKFKRLKTGADIKIDKIWEAGSNISLRLQDGLGFEGHIKIPDDIKETHSIFGDLTYKDTIRNSAYLLKYRTSYSLRKYGFWGKVSARDNTNLSGNIEVEWDSKRYNNYANLKRPGTSPSFDFIYKLKTPHFANKQFLAAQINLNSLKDRYNLTSEIFHPEDRSVAYATVDFKELDNMDGMFNVTVPYKQLNYTGAYFNTETTEILRKRYAKVFWDGNNAILDSNCDIKTNKGSVETYMKGKLIAEIPLATRHVTIIDYEYNKEALNSNGRAIVNYNGSNVLDGIYKSKTESRKGFNKDDIHVEINNNMLPLGADYVHKQEYELKNNYNASTMDSKSVHIYNLQNRTKFNLTGELYVKTTKSGQEYILTATHTNRTIKLWSDYDVFDKEYTQHSRLELSPAHWIEYDLRLFNKTVDEVFDAQELLLNVLYPRRSFTAQGFYNISDSIVSTDVSLLWDKEQNKVVQVGMDWKRASTHREQLLFEIKHPSFEKNVTFFSEYGYGTTSLDGIILVDYSLDPDKRLTVSGELTDNSNSQLRNYSYNIWAEHNATSLYLNTRGDFYWNPSVFGTEHITDYRRSYLPLTTSEARATINLDKNQIELKKNGIDTGLSYFFGTYGGEFPIYTANMSISHGTNDTAGEFYINLKNKLVYLNVNTTEDGSQSLHMYGFIPDARSAVFDIWREYEEKKVFDVSYYLRLNHSRLITSRLQWRPELTGDIQSNIRSNLLQVYLSILDNINNTKQYIRTETSEAIHGIWADAKPNIHQFLSDLRNLSIIENDIEQLKQFLNKSYYANEFYIKDIATVIITMFDDLALKSHLQSLPKIVQEIWSVMGDSGQKIKKGILWVIEKIKLYYKNTTEFIHGFINGDPVEHISKVFEQVIERYDNFIKNVHVVVIQYMEKLWTQTYSLVVEHWHKTLAAIEPTFLKFVHYLESIVWSTGKEFLDFLYLRKNEIIESPYFVKFTKFSHDIDRFYKDITGRNIIANIYKYSTIAWNFLQEKYLSSIPFGKELSAIINEILMELKQVGNIPSVKYVLGKWHEAYEYGKYYYKYFDIENRIQKMIMLVYIKFSDMSVTALEAENRHRVAKTKFVFEPDDGIMILEQKLPMPWHAFNETPKFKEIPEVKAIYDLQSYFEASKISFWNLYYDYKPFLNPSEWLPPFKAQAMLVGNKYYTTFDRRYYDFQGSCTYLLATDFIDHNFTLLASYDSTGDTSELILLLNKTIVRIDLLGKDIQIGGSGLDRLPLQIGDTYLYQESDILIVDSASGYTLECNMKFHICVFEMAGWYFGKTAGLWGTYNNEPSDDFITSSKLRMNTSSIESFGDSWVVNKNCKTNVKKERPKTSVKNLSVLCDEFFTSKVSQLSTCFPRIPKKSFLEMCLNSETEEEACMSAVSYINLCSYANVPLRIPDTCVKCTLLNGTKIKEGDSIQLQGDKISKTADIVFIVEAKKCNRDLKKLKNFETVIEMVEKELVELNITSTRYAAVVFGGDGVYDEPRSIILKGNTFTDSKSIVNYFSNLPIGNGNKDIFNAIIYAYSLLFRPGASRNFILMPCSDCNKYNMDHDYSTVLQLLLEGATTLNILMKDQLTMQKERESKVPFGMDRSYAYTKKDIRTLVGDQLLRRSIILPKPSLGVCLSLTLETNGTIFSAKYLETDRKAAKRFSAVFAKAVARRALPRQCVECECTAPNTGVSYMDCYQCSMMNTSRNVMEHHALSFEDEDTFGYNVFDGFSL